MVKLALAIPCYNEEEALPSTSVALKNKYIKLMSENKISSDSRIVFIDDGSKDKTWSIICALHDSDKMFSGIKLSRNQGHQNALLAGLMTLKEEFDAVISIDADLQDDIDVFDDMIAQFEDNCDIVYGVRSSRKKDTFFKRFSAEGYYHLLNKTGANIVFNHADFRLMSKRALCCLEEYKEANLFLRGIMPMIGFKTGVVEYERLERTAGKSNYPLKKMLALAWQGITSLSTYPIKVVTAAGLIVFLVSIGMLIYFLIRYFIGATIVGWASIAVSVWAIGGLQLLAIGIIGEYIGKVYLETKHRPRYFIETYLK